jgi:energy-coupling factor transport system ATP-binding protein
MEDMAMYCDKIVVMSHGKIILEGEPKDVFSQAKLLQSAGLDVPEISKIATALREKDVRIPRDIYTVDGAYEALLKVVSGGDSDGI